MRVGAIAYRDGAKGTEICLVSSRKHKGTLTFPKGWVHEGESLVKAVKRELLEEAGLKGKVKRKRRPVYVHEGDNSEYVPVLYFLVKIKKSEDVWREMNERKRVFAELRDFGKLPLGAAPRAMHRRLSRIKALVKVGNRPKKTVSAKGKKEQPKSTAVRTARRGAGQDTTLNL